MRATAPSATAASQAHLDDVAHRGDALVQQYASAVAGEGEWSVVLVDGVVSHALRKRPGGR